MSVQNRKFDSYDEAAFSEDSDLNLSLKDKNTPSTTTKVDVKKRKGDSEKYNMKLKQIAKKRKETAKDRLLKWNSFYTSKSFGILIQCTKCNKWRKVVEYEEEHEVPDDWCCTMNRSGTRSCDEPENTENVELEFSPMNFIPGTIVWAKYTGYPWWPGMVEIDPDTEEYVWLEKNGKCSYNITFLDDKVTRAWVSASFVRPFLDPQRHKYLTKGHSKYSSLIAAAEIKARQAMMMTIQERLQKFSFAHQYKGKWGSPLPSDDSDEDEMEEEKDLTRMVLEEMDDIESVNSTDSDCKSLNSVEQKKNETNNQFGHCEIFTKDNLEHKKNQANRNKQLIETQSMKESGSTNGDNVAYLKENVKEEANSLNELIDETNDLDVDISHVTETEKNLETFVVSKGIMRTYLKLKETAKANKDVTSSEEAEEYINYSSKHENTLMKTSKTKNKKADKLENLDTKENQDKRKSSLLKKHMADTTSMDEKKKQNNKEKTLNNSSNSKFKPPVRKNITASYEDNQSSKSIKNKKIATNVSNSDSAIEEKNLAKTEICEKNLEENKHLDKTSTTEENISRNVENNRSSKEDIKCENSLKKSDIVEEKILNSLESKSVSMQENKNYTNYDSNTNFQETLNAGNNKDNIKQKKKAYKKNYEEALASSDSQDNNENYDIRSKSTNFMMQKKRNILKADSSTEDLHVSSAGTSEPTVTLKSSARRNAGKREKRGKKSFRYEVEKETEEMKRKQDNEIISASDDNMLKDIAGKGSSKEENVSLSLKKYSIFRIL